MDDSVLTVDRVRAAIPTSLNTDDSLSMAHTIIEGWVEDRLFEAYLSIEPEEQQRIDRLTEDYRRKLRTEAYRRKIRRDYKIPVNEDSVKAYFALHGHEMICERPLAKGVLVKADASSPSVAQIRRLVRTATTADIDHLREETEPGLISISYFGETWVEFENVASDIPYRFGDLSEFLKNNSNFETTHSGVTWILHIYDWKDAGERMPYDFAAPQIRDILQESRLESYRRGLIKALRTKATREGRFESSSNWE